MHANTTLTGVQMTSRSVVPLLLLSAAAPGLNAQQLVDMATGLPPSAQTPAATPVPSEPLSSQDYAQPFVIAGAVSDQLAVVDPRASNLERPAPSTATVVFTHVNLVPMTRDTVLEDMTVFIDGDRIVRIDRASEALIPSGALVIDGRGRYLMPGLADAHAHLVVTIGASPEVRTQWQNINEQLLVLGLSQGITTVIEMGGVGLAPDPDRVLPELRREIATGKRLGPTIYLATAKANDSTLTREQGMLLVDSARAAGYDLIKVYNALSREGYRGIMIRAAELNIPVAGHVVRSIGLEGALGSGQRGIVHLEEYPYTFFPFRVTDTLQVPERILDQSAIPYLARITRESGVFITPTLVTFRTLLAQAENLDSVLARPEVRNIPSELYDVLWVPGLNPYAPRFSHPRRVHNLRTALAFQRQLVREFHRAGVPLLVGSDAPAAGVVPGYSLHEELRNLVEVGLTPFEALAAATRNTASFLGTDEFGTVKTGKRADLLLLEGNPLLDVTNAQEIVGVLVRGRWHTITELHTVLDVAGRPALGEPGAAEAHGRPTAGGKPQRDAVHRPAS
jgi:imidazolonepropionase-like amidohydrolase